MNNETINSKKNEKAANINLVRIKAIFGAGYPACFSGAAYYLPKG